MGEYDPTATDDEPADAPGNQDPDVEGTEDLPEQADDATGDEDQGDSGTDQEPSGEEPA